jgi:hypothetical protein
MKGRLLLDLLDCMGTTSSGMSVPRTKAIRSLVCHHTRQPDPSDSIAREEILRSDTILTSSSVVYLSLIREPRAEIVSQSQTLQSYCST